MAFGRWRLVPCLICVAAVGSVSTPVVAQDVALTTEARGVALRWDAPEPCMDEATLREVTSHRLGREVFAVGTDAALVVVGRVEATPESSWHVSLSLRDRDGTSLGSRELRSLSPDCRDLDEELPIVVALLVDQQRDVALYLPPPEAPEPQPRVAAPSPGESETGPETAAPVVTAKPFPSLAVQAGVSFSVGDMPEFAAGPHGLLALTLNRWLSVEASATFWPLSSYAIPHGRVALSAWDIGAALCAQRRAPRWLSWGGCAGARGGRFQAAGEGFVVNQSGNGARATITLSLRGQAHVGPLDVVLDVGAGIPLIHNALTVTAPGTTERVFDPEPIHFFFSLGIRTPGGAD